MSFKKLIAEERYNQSVESCSKAVVREIARKLPLYDINPETPVDQLYDAGFLCNIMARPVIHPANTFVAIMKNPRKVEVVRDYLEAVMDDFRKLESIPPLGLVFPVKGFRYIVVHPFGEVTDAPCLRFKYKDIIFTCEPLVSLLERLRSE